MGINPGAIDVGQRNFQTAAQRPQLVPAFHFKSHPVPFDTDFNHWGISRLENYSHDITVRSHWRPSISSLAASISLLSTLSTKIEKSKFLDMVSPAVWCLPFNVLHFFARKRGPDMTQKRRLSGIGLASLQLSLP